MTNKQRENYVELKEIIDEQKIGDRLIHGDEGIEDLIENLNKKQQKLFEDIEVIDSYGGEGLGEEYWSVFKFPNAGDLMIRFNGYYQSYNGAEYEDCEPVEPKVVEVTIYESIE